MNLNDFGTREERDEFSAIVRDYLEQNGIILKKYSSFLRIKILDNYFINILPKPKQKKISIILGSMQDGASYDINGDLSSPDNSNLDKLVNFCKQAKKFNDLFFEITGRSEHHFLI